MAVSQSDIDAIDSAIISGTKSVRFSDREVTYQSVADMLAARAMMVNLLAAENGNTLPNGQQVIRQRRMYTSKGF